MSVEDGMLMAFVDGELSEPERARVEAALAKDPALRARLAEHQALRTRLSAAFDDVLDEPVPERLVAASAAPTRGAEVVDFAAKRAARWSAREWGAMAASVAAGLLIGVGVMGGGSTPMIAESHDGLVARGDLARALDTQLASDEGGAVRIGLSFVSTDGEYCRTFALARANAAGLACRGGDGWSIEMTTGGAGGGEVRMAGASAEILARVDTMIEGDALDADGERAARGAGWQGAD